MPKNFSIALLSFGLFCALFLDRRAYVEESAPVEERPANVAMPSLQPLPSPSNESAAGEKSLREIFAAGKFQEAKAMIEAQLRKSGSDPDYRAWLKKQLIIVKTALAWSAVQKHDCRTAQDELRGLDMQAAPPLAAKALGYCSMKEKDWASAEQYLEFYVGKQGQDPEGFMLLSSIKEAQGSYDEAIDLNEKAIAIDASSKKLAMKAQSLSAQQEESLTQTELASGSVRIRYQAPIHYELAQNALEIINDTLQRLNTQLGLEYPENTIEIIFHTVQGFEKITHGPAWASALYDGEIRVPIPEGLTDVRAIAEILRHEITHAVLDEQANKRPLPAWFQEGLAQVAEKQTFGWTFDFAASTSTFLPLPTFNKSFIGMNDRDAQVAYKQSRYLMILLYRRHHLSGMKEIMTQLRTLPALDSDSILSAVGMSFQDLYDDAARHWNAGRSL